MDTRRQLAHQHGHFDSACTSGRRQDGARAQGRRADVFGHALDVAQCGGKHPDVKPLSGFGSAGVLEVVEDLRGDTFRAVYTVKFAGWLYVLHCFQKKSKSGIKTPKEDLNLIHTRLKAAKQDFEDWLSTQGAP
ncbi:MAG: type II toxin-antitoxin system RelE/ParE family toxin [Burkholderiales bacterium]|nr:type II toxin-antitoxin system RelE/ParE family toxin [Burkholderiales bacterium]